MIADPPLLPGAVQRTVADALPAVAVPMVGAPGALPAAAAAGWLPLGDPAGRTDSAQLAPRGCPSAGLVSSRDVPVLASGQPAPP